MKKLVALFLVLVLACGMNTAMATDYPQYDATMMKSVSETASELTSNSTIRAMTAALILLDYFVAADGTDILEKVASSGTSYIAAYGSCVDVYYYRTDGKYTNIFYAPGTKKLTDYGISSSKPSSSQYTYYSVGNDDLASSIIDILEYLQK